MSRVEEAKISLHFHIKSSLSFRVESAIVHTFFSLALLARLDMQWLCQNELGRNGTFSPQRNDNELMLELSTVLAKARKICL